MMTIKTYGLAVTVYAYIQRKIVVSISLTTIYANFEGFFDDHFEVILKPLCGERGIRTPGTVTRSPHFECGPFDHSGISPCGLGVDYRVQKYNVRSK